MNNDKHEFARKIVRYIARLERQRRYYLDEHLSKYHLQGSMFMIILFLDKNPGVSQDVLSDYLLIDKSGVTRRLCKLENLGYIKRLQSENDRRQNRLYLTEEGKALLPVIRALLSQWRNKVTADMNECEQKELLRLLELMEKNAENNM